MIFLEFPNIDFGDDRGMSDEQWAIRMHEYRKVSNRLHHKIPYPELNQRLEKYIESNRNLAEISLLLDYIEVLFPDPGKEFWYRLGVFTGQRMIYGK